MLSLGVRPKIIGSFPKEGTFIIMMNHSSFIDIFLFSLFEFGYILISVGLIWILVGFFWIVVGFSWIAVGFNCIAI